MRLPQRAATLPMFRSLLDAQTPALAKRTITSGVGWRRIVIGRARDDASKAHDLRVEFKVIGC